MIAIRKYISTALFLLFPILCLAQTKKIEALSSRLIKSETSEEKLHTILALCEEYQSMNRDTLYNLALQARHLSLVTSDKDKIGLAAIALSNAYMQWGWTDSAIASLEPALAKKNDYSPAIYLKLLRNDAIIYANRSEYETALSMLYPSLSLAEKANDTLNRSAIMNTIGSISMAREKPDEALEWIQKAEALCSGNERCKTVLASVYANAANAYLKKDNLDSALFYSERAIPLSRKIENLFILASALRIKAAVLTREKRFPEAESAFKEMIAIRKISSEEGIFIEDNLKLADFYASSGQLEKAISLCKNALDIKDDSDTSATNPRVKNPKLRLEYFLALSKYYKQAKNNIEYQETLEQIVALKDSLYLGNSNQSIAEAETKYEVQKKENTILQQKFSLQKSRFLLYGSLILLGIATIIAYYVMRDYKRRQKLKMDIALKIAEEKERIRIAADLHDNIGAYASAIRNDVENITNLGLGNSSLSLQNLQHHSQEIMNSLRDTIWVLNKENITITGISDRIKNFLSRMQSSYSLVQFNIHETIMNDVCINSQSALNIFRIVQEAVHNSLKHSHAKNIFISIKSIDVVEIILSDDGKGMDNAKYHEMGNGFANMHTRALESGLTLKIESTVNEGLTVSIRLFTAN